MVVGGVEGWVLGPGEDKEQDAACNAAAGAGGGSMDARDLEQAVGGDELDPLASA